MRLAKELLVSSGSMNYLSEAAYDSTKWNLGKGIIFNNGITAVDKYIAPQFDAVRPMEQSTAFAVQYVFSHNFSPTIDYLFGIENSTTASATRRVHLWEINKKTGARSWKGYITLTLATSTAHTVRDFKVDVKNESSGTVSVSGTAVTGSSTLFSTNRVAVGARIGFGSTDPTQISTWYRVSAVGSDTGITLATSAGTIGGGTDYVIQEFRQVYVATNATTTNGGIHYAKGVSIEDFISTGTTISLAVSTDNVKAVYWLKDASTQTNIVSAGSALDFASATATSLDCYVLDLVSAGNYKIFKYNIRAALTVASGASTSAFTLATGNQGFTGTGAQNANLCIATTAHGTGSGVKCLYCITTTRIYRIAVTNVTSASTTFFSDNIAEIPTGNTNSYAVTNILSTIEYMADIDAFIVASTHASSAHSYVTRYVTSGNQWDIIWGRDMRYFEQSTKDSALPLHFSNSSVLFGFNDSGSTNLVYGVRAGTTASLNVIYILPFGCHWTFAGSSAGRLISPAISTPNANKYYRVFANHIGVVGSGELSKATEPIKLYARTSNINTDATSGWTLLDESNDLSGFGGASEIQFMVEFKTIAELCIPSRILGFNVSYEDNTTDSHYQFSATKSDAANKRFAWRFATAFGSSVPALRVRLYNAVTGGLLVDDNTAAPTGTFERSTDGTSFSSWNNTDKGNETTYLRYTPASLADDINVMPVLTIN